MNGGSGYHGDHQEPAAIEMEDMEWKPQVRVSLRIRIQHKKLCKKLPYEELAVVKKQNKKDCLKGEKKKKTWSLSKLTLQMSIK